jgi:hypothetical protein
MGATLNLVFHPLFIYYNECPAFEVPYEPTSVVYLIKMAMHMRALEANVFSVSKLRLYLYSATFPPHTE